MNCIQFKTREDLIKYTGKLFVHLLTFPAISQMITMLCPFRGGGGITLLVSVISTHGQTARMK